MRALTAIASALNLAATLAAALMVAFIFVSATLRYLAGAPLRFSDELVGVLFLSMAFLAMPRALLLGQHIRISILVNAYPPRLRRVCSVASAIILLAFCAVFAVKSWDFAYFSYQIDARSDVARIWLFPWMAIMPVATAVLFVSTATNLVLTVVHRQGKPTSAGQ